MTGTIATVVDLMSKIDMTARHAPIQAQSPSVCNTQQSHEQKQKGGSQNPITANVTKTTAMDKNVH